MGTINLVDFVIGFASLVLVIGLFIGPWQTLVIATARQFVFELRDAWFDVTHADEDVRRNEAAERVRKAFNSAIQLMDQFTLTNLLVMIVFRRSIKMESHENFVHPARGMPYGDSHKLALRLLRCSATYVIAQALSRSVFFFPLGIYLMWATRRHAKAICHHGRRPQMLHMRGVVREVERATMAMGDDTQIGAAMQHQRGRAIAA